MERNPARPARLVAAWVAVALAAIGAGTWGVQLVGSSVTDGSPAPLTAEEVAVRLEADQATTTVPDATTTTAAGGPVVVDVTDATTQDGGSDPASTPGTAPGSGPSPTTTAAPGSAGSTSTTTTPTTTTSTTAAPATVETRTYNVTGGSVALRFSPDGVTVVYANPAPGFDVEVEPEHGNGVKVEFESDTHESRVDGWWSGGPQDRVEERARD